MSYKLMHNLISIVHNRCKQITASESQCEEHYTQSPYIAEYYCTLSNIPLLFVGLYFMDIVTVFAAFMSIVSHAIPSQLLHNFDMLAVAMIFMDVVMNYDILLSNVNVIVVGILALMFGAADIYNRRCLGSINSMFHVMWHLAAALALYEYNSAKYIE